MIDEKRLKRNLELFSFPRLSGSVGEKKAFNLVLANFKKLNLTPNIQDFTFTTYFAKYYPKIIISILTLLLLLFYLNIKSIIIPILYLINMVILSVHLLLVRSPEHIKIGKRLQSQNVIITILSKNSNIHHNKNSERHILFFCHLDSKSQRFSILTRIRAARIWFFSSVISLILIVLKNYFFIHLFLLIYFLGAIPLTITFLAAILILLNTTGNKSNGAIDDASGIVCVLELLNHYLNTKFRLQNFTTTFVFTGAEENGTIGIRYYYQKIKDLSRENTIIFNFDAIARSVSLFPGKKISKNVEPLLNTFLNYSNRLKLRINAKRFYIGSHSDGYYLKKKGFRGFGIGDMESYMFIHSVNDTIDRIDTSLLKELLEAIVTILKDYDTSFNIT